MPLVLVAATAAPLFAQTVVGTINRPGWAPTALGLYKPGNKLFVADDNTGTLHVFDATTFAELGSVPTSLSGVTQIVVDEPRGKLYASCTCVGESAVAIVNAATSALLGYVTVGTRARLAVDEGLGKVYLMGQLGLRQIDTTTDAVTDVPGISSLKTAIAVNPVTHEVFMTQFAQPGTLDIVDGVTLARSSVDGLEGFGIGVNWIENKVYTSYGLAVYDRDTGTITNLPNFNDTSNDLVFNPVSNRMYTTAEVNAFTSIIEGATDQLFDLPFFSGSHPAVRSATGHVYYGQPSPVVILDDATQQLEFIPLPPAPATGLTYVPDDIAINQTTGLVYMLHGGNVEVLQDTGKLTRPPIYVGTLSNSRNVFVLDPVSRAVVDEWGAAYPEHNLAVRPGGGRVYLPTSQSDEGSDLFQTYGGAGWRTLLGSFAPGGNDPTAAAVTPDGDRVYVTNRASANVSVIDPATSTVPATIPVGSTPWGLAVTPDGRKVYVANRGSNTVSVIDTVTNTVGATVGVGSLPWGVAVNPAGTRVYVANASSGTVSVIDTFSNLVMATVPVGSNPHWLAVTPDGRSVYIGNRGNATVSVLSTGTNVVTQTVPVGVNPEGVGALPDGTEVWVVSSNLSAASSLSVIDTSDFSVATVPLPANSREAVALAIADPASKFAGRVTANGLPVTGALVRALQASAEIATAVTNEAGDYSLFNLVAGTYDLEVSASGQPVENRPGHVVGIGRTTVIHVSFTDPSPTLTSLSPPSVPAGGAAFTVTVIGSAFAPGSVVCWNGSSRTTTFVSASELRAAIPASDIVTAGTAQVSVLGSGGDSNALPLEVENVPFNLSVDDVTVAEGDSGTTPAVFTVSLAPARGQVVTVNYQTAGGTATAGAGSASNTTPITIPIWYEGTPYPSSLSLASLPGTLTKVTATLHGLSHTHVSDVDILLVGPEGQTVVLLSDVGGGTAVTNATLTFDDAAPGSVPTPVASGTYRATNNVDTGLDYFPAPAPSGPYGSLLSVFNGTSPNGTWSLFVVGDAGLYTGAISGGWTLTLSISAAGGDYIATSGTLTFPPGSTQKTVTVDVMGDLAVEPDETFFVNLSGAVQAVVSDGQGQGTILNDDCGDYTSLVPDGRVITGSLGAGATAWYLTSLRTGSSYSVEATNDQGPAGLPAMTVFRSTDGCTVSTVTVRDTAALDPPSAVSSRGSFKVEGPDGRYHIRVVNGTGATLVYSLALAETTLFSPAWSTGSSFDTYYSVQNTTNITVTGTLTLRDTTGAIAGTATLVIPPGRTSATNTGAMAVLRNRTGTGELSHDGPPGAVLPQTAIANFASMPAYVQTVKFISVRERK